MKTTMAARGTMNVQRWQWRGPISLTSTSAEAEAEAHSPLWVSKRRSAKQRGLLLLVAINALALSGYLLGFGLISSPQIAGRLESIKNKRHLHRELCSEGSGVVVPQLDMTLTWGQWIARVLRRLSPVHGDGDEGRRLASGCNFTDYIYTQEVQVVAPPTPPPTAAPSISPTPKPVGFFDGLFGSSSGTSAPSPQPTPLPGHPTKAPIATDAPTDAPEPPSPKPTSFPTNPPLPPGTPPTPKPPTPPPVAPLPVPAPTEPAPTNPIVAVEPIGLPDPPEEPYTEDPNGPANPEPPAYDIAYVLTISECPADPQTGPSTASINALSFYDSFSLLRHGVCNCTKSNQILNPETGLLEPLSDYDSTMYALVHSQAVTCQAADGTWYDLVASLQGMGFFVKIFDEPVYADEIVGSQYLKENIEADVGIRDLLRLHAYTLTNHELVMLVEPSTMMLQPVDELFNDLINDPTTMATYTTEPNGDIDLGMVIIRPSLAEFEAIKNIFKTVEFDDTSGWGGTGIGAGTQGGLGSKGLLTYYYTQVATAPSLVADRCIYGNEAFGPCLNVTMGDIKIARLLPEVCGSPWKCSYESAGWDSDTETRCTELIHEWFRKRLDLEDSHWANAGQNIDRLGTFHSEVFSGFCDIEGDEGYKNMLRLSTTLAPTSTPTTPLPTVSPTQAPTVSLDNGCYGDTSRYNICLDTSTGTRNNFTRAFYDAKVRWEEIIVGDLPSVPAPNDPDGTCFRGMPEEIDDVYVCAKFITLDGEYGTLGAAGPRYIRSNYLPVSGLIEFDSADVDRLLLEGTWRNLAMHELAHVIGVGSFWSQLGLASGGSYTGIHGCEAWQDVTGCGPGSCPPVETDGGAGTAGGHWDEAVFEEELMTGYADDGDDVYPISKVTIGSLQDLGYTVNYDAADEYTVLNPVCSSRRLGLFDRSTNAEKQGTRRLPKKKLSDFGRGRAKERGKSGLKRAKQNRPNFDPPGLMYVGHLFQDVLYFEDGVVHYVESFDCVAGSEFCLHDLECCSGTCEMFSNTCLEATPEEATARRNLMERIWNSLFGE